jgi:hypothetical protein
MTQILGLIFGDQQHSLPGMHTSSLLGTDTFTHPLVGSGNLLVRLKENSFFWLVLQERLNTRALLKRKNMPLPDYSCVLCACGIEEELSHLLFHCPFSLVYGTLST